jgi:hypothetical protein
MKKTVFLFSFLCCFSISKIYAQRLSSSAKISLITCDVGNEIYSLFGHTAIRISDPEKNIEEIYNYGTFDGFEDNFELKFAQGKLNYWLSKQTLENFLMEYEYYNRTVYQQTLNLTNDEVNTIYAFLLENFKPENRKYQYEFFYDNCATRVRDVFQNVLGSSIIWNNHPWHNQYTFRQLIARDLVKAPFTHLGIDLVLGKKIDVNVSTQKLMFHPIYMMETFDLAERKLGGKTEKLVTEKIILFQGISSNVSSTNSPLYVAWSLFFLAAILTFFRLNKIGYVFDFSLSYIFGLLGIVLLLMWFATDHSATKYNFNLLWASPLLLLFPILYKKQSKQGFALLTALLFFVFAGAFILPQEFNSAVIPLVLALGLRYFHNYRKLS